MEMQPGNLPTSDDDKEGFMHLLRGILQDLRTLFSKEFIAAKLEFAQEIGKTVKASVTLAVGLFILAVGFVLLSLMLVFVLVEYTELLLWASLGVVGIGYAIIGIVFVLVGKNKVASAKPFPQETLRSTKEDVRYISERAAGH